MVEYPEMKDLESNDPDSTKWPPEALCSSCKQLSLAHIIEKGPIEHVPFYIAWCNAFSCGLCYFINECSENESAFANYSRTWKRSFIHFALSNSEFDSCLWISPTREGEGHEILNGPRLRIFSSPGASDIALSQFPVCAYGSARDSDNIHEEEVRFLQASLDECINNHQECSLPPDSKIISHLPTRVLDVGSNHDPMVYLIHSNNKQSPYVTLSHCWGPLDSQRLVTTATNLSKMNHGVLLNDLPKTIRDAVLVTRALELRYLWVDSLCILQGDRHDWLSEGSKMAAYYRNAHFTVCASDASSDNDGVFTSRDAIWSLKMRIDNGNRMSNFVRLQRPSPFHNATSTSRWRGPLAQRGWTMQEYVLSRRLIHFTKYGIAWECRRYLREEDRSITQGFGFETMKSFTKLLAKAEEISRTSVDTKDSHWRNQAAAEFQSAWRTLVIMFTNRKLTFQDDKTLAFSAVIDEVCKRSGLICHAGLWAHSIQFDMLWRLDYTVELSHPARSYSSRAPSWSWMSMDAPVIYMLESTPESSRDLNFDVVDIETPQRMRGRISTQPIQNLAMLIRGLCRTAYVMYNRKSDLGDGWDTESYALSNLEQSISSLRLGSAHPDDPERMCRYLGVNLSSARREEVPEEDQLLGIKVLCLKAATGRFVRGGVDEIGYESTEHVVLILLEVPGTGNYERVGIGHVDQLDWFDSIALQEIRIQ